MRHRILWVFIFVLYPMACDAASSMTADNFSLPTSQQAGPLTGFGENIINKNQVQLFLLADQYGGIDKHYTECVPSILYGISDTASITLGVPYAIHYQENNAYSSGLEDSFAQFEYVFYQKEKPSSYADQATIVLGIAAPTGSINKNPSTGNGSMSYFIGTTYNRTFQNSFIYISPGVEIPTRKNKTREGTSYLYQAGCGKNFMYYHDWILAGIAEIDGTYEKRNVMSGTTDPNSGGNVVFLTPSLWASTRTLTFQLGVGFPIIQHLNGDQNRYTYLVAGNVGWTVN